MANTLGIDFDADNKEIEQDLGNVIKWHGKTYPAATSIPTVGRVYEDDGSGYYIMRHMICSVRRSVIGTTIAQGDEIEYDGNVYRVESKSYDTESASHVMTCKGEAK
jgi:hypothetical protein